MPPRRSNIPRSKEELINQVFSYNGGVRLDESTTVIRIAPHIMRLTYPDGSVYDLTVHIPRKEHQKARQMAKSGPLLDDWEKEVVGKPHYPATPSKPAKAAKKKR